MARTFENGDEVIQYSLLISENALLSFGKVIAVSDRYENNEEKNTGSINCELVMSVRCYNDHILCFRRYDTDSYVIVENGRIRDVSADRRQMEGFADYYISAVRE